MGKIEYDFVDDVGFVAVEALAEYLKRISIPELRDSKVMVDLGCGRQCFTSRGLMPLCPNLERIYTVDKNVFPEVRLPFHIRHFNHLTTMNKFLQTRKTLKADVIVIGSVPIHNLHKEDGYKNLYSRTQSGGIVIEIGDTNLNQESMEQVGFGLLYDMRTAAKVWKKQTA
jgi:hypothetical protein